MILAPQVRWGKRVERLRLGRDTSAASSCHHRPEKAISRQWRWRRRLPGHMREASLDCGLNVFIVREDFNFELDLLAWVQEHREWPFLRSTLGFEEMSRSAEAAWSRR